MSERLSHPIRP